MQAESIHSQIPRALVACYQVGMELNLRIRDIREARGLTLADVAGRVGISSPHLSGVERGQKNLNNHLLVRIASALGVAPEDLISSEARSDISSILNAMDDLSADEVERVKAFALALRQSRTVS